MKPKKQRYFIPAEERRRIAEIFPGIEVRWTISRARDTFGQNRVSLWIHTETGRRERVASCTGGGYDLPGECLGEWIRKHPFLTPGIMHLNAARVRGLTFYDEKAKRGHARYRPGDRITIDGKRGFSAMGDLLAALGFYLRRTENRANVQFYEFRSI